MYIAIPKTTIKIITQRKITNKSVYRLKQNAKNYSCHRKKEGTKEQKTAQIKSNKVVDLNIFL